MPVTPMIRQYLDIKSKYADAILFFRLGDFYEMFFDDAKIVSRELELTLTGKDCGLSERAPMCGVPYHAVDAYVARLIEKGYKVAICEQTSDPALSKGLVEREITRVVTPGTVIETGMLEEKKPNYILSVALKKDAAGMAFADVSTGEFMLYELSRAELSDEIRRISPKEVITSDSETLRAQCAWLPHAVSERDAGDFEYSNAKRALGAHFGKDGLSELGKLAMCAAGALIIYLTETQKNALTHILALTPYERARYLIVDHAASANLELTQTVRGQSRKGSLLSTLDKTVTSMGSRLVRQWIEHPLALREDIVARLDAVDALKRDQILLDGVRSALKGVYDVERLLSKIAYESVNPRDCLALASSLRAVPGLRALLSGAEGLLSGIVTQLDPMRDLEEEISRALVEDAPIQIKEGGIFRAGYDAGLDKLRDISGNGKAYLAALEQKEREATGIKNLKVAYNRVFGYYIEVTKSFYDSVPYRYVRKQTLANCERFITDELKELEKSVLGADEDAVKLEYELFSKLRARLTQALRRLNCTAMALKTLDALAAFAQAAQEYDYVRPEINTEGRYEIKMGRHPVVEQALGIEQFVPNDTSIDSENRVMIITGPNMAGKSTYMRQVALITLMAHTGSFVPAESADISLTDRIFTRIGASDDLYGGQSTFMVEMSEMATILKHATRRSLVILDEVGRGTSTFDGLSIAWAAVEYLASDKCAARTLFATHYHELSVLQGQLPGVVNYRVTAREQGDDVIFLRKVVQGDEDRSYGVAVAKLAGLPGGVIARARQIMSRLEVDDEARGSIGKSILDKRKNAGDRQVKLTDYRPMELIEEIRAIDVMGMTPVDALNTLYRLNEKARRI